MRWHQGHRALVPQPQRLAAAHRRLSPLRLVWSDPRPHDARRFYEDEYRVDYKHTSEPRPRHVLRAGRGALVRLEKIRPYLSGSMRILDVGSGGGEFAYLLKTLGHDVTAVEPNRGYAGYSARQYGFEVTRAFVGDVALAGQCYDLITVWHVLEHTEDPGAVLRQLGAALRRNGALVVEVPNVEATCQSPRHTFHEAHLYSFNGATLERLAAKAGLRACAGRLSANGGNITAVFRPLPGDSAAADRNATAEGPQAAGADRLPMLPGNHDRVVAAVRGHTPVSYWLSAHPHRRLAARVARALAEWRETRRPVSGRERLDALYAQALRPDPRHATTQPDAEPAALSFPSKHGRPSRPSSFGS